MRFASEISKILYFFGGCGIMKSRDWEDMPDSPFRLQYSGIQHRTCGT